MASLPIEKRLLHYFIAMGAQQGEQDPSTQDLSLILGNERVKVVILCVDTNSQRSRIMDTILKLTMLRNSSDLLYLAAPKILGTIIDAAIFRSNGIGLLLFDERRIEEIAAPQNLRQPQEARAIRSEDTALLAEISSLRSMYLEMERTISTLREDLKNFKENAGAATEPQRNVPQPQILAPESIFSGASSHLPSFFTNNPWLDLLSKRGREDTFAA